MTDEAPDIEPDTPDNAAPENEGDAANSPEAVVDWRQRYESLRPEFDRRNEELKEAQAQAQLVAALRSDDPKERAWAAEELGLEYEDPDLYDDTPDDPTAKQLSELLAWKEEVDKREQERSTVAQQQADFEYVFENVEKLGYDLDSEEEKADLEVITKLALNQRDEHGQPDVAAAVDLVKQIRGSGEKGVFKGKKNAPYVAPGGQSATQQPDLDNDKARQEWMIQQLRGQSNT
jgi:hypothetical protein